MNFANSKKLFLISVVVSAFALFSPWANSSYRVGETGEKISLSVSMLDDSLTIEGCRRGSALGQDKHLDNWIQFGRTAYLGQIALWLFFLFKVYKSRKLGEVVIWLAGITVFLCAFLMLSHPIIECQWKETPPPLMFMGQWQISLIGVSLFIISALFGVLANILNEKTSA
jgi:hypothetical protein